VRFDGAQVSVEVRGSRLSVVRMAGVLDPVTVARLATVAAAQMARCTGHIVVDLGEVRFFGTDDLEALVTVDQAASAAGLRLHLAGIAGREGMLPAGIAAALARFSMFPTVEHAERELIGRVPAVATTSSPRSSSVWPCSPLVVTDGVRGARTGTVRSGG
jgi:anti-anti-sigma regulatory factor